ncbi:tautomerase [Roseivivax isoporae LMG 25204]|uniref:Tautomerase n=2 Tax=Roseivivax TaxID=93682 RepID=X7F7R4_9RHOB|nr:tautomerase family protein [Roseivivax isoporae]ETX28778.1 tautomerase [Roseivivax isoporae LMG 25204]
MPVVRVHLLDGYDEAAKRRLGEALTDAVRTVIPADPDAVTVMIEDVPAANYMRGRISRQGAAPLPDPCATVRRYLDAMEARDLDAARAMLGPRFSMNFPGTGPMTDLAELVAWSRPRYRHVTKTYEGMDVCPSPGPVTVYARGTLSGAWPDGDSFEGVRFIDRFELQDGLITRQDVWNDIAEVRP